MSATLTIEYSLADARALAEAAAESQANLGEDLFARLAATNSHTPSPKNMKILTPSDDDCDSVFEDEEFDYESEEISVISGDGLGAVAKVPSSGKLDCCVAACCKSELEDGEIYENKTEFSPLSRRSSSQREGLRSSLSNCASKSQSVSITTKDKQTLMLSIFDSEDGKKIHIFTSSPITLSLTEFQDYMEGIVDKEEKEDQEDAPEFIEDTRWDEFKVIMTGTAIGISILVLMTICYLIGLSKNY